MRSTGRPPASPMSNTCLARGTRRGCERADSMRCRSFARRSLVRSFFRSIVRLCDSAPAFAWVDAMPRWRGKKGEGRPWGHSFQSTTGSTQRAPVGSRGCVPTLTGLKQDPAMGRVVVSAARGRRRPGPVQAVSNGRIEGRGTSVRRGREGEGDETEGDDAREGSAAMLTTARHRRVARDAHVVRVCPLGECLDHLQAGIRWLLRGGRQQQLNSWTFHTVLRCVQ